MLVLSRSDDQGISMFSGDDCIHIKVVSVKGSRVRLCITAPPHVKILRDEILTAQEALECLSNTSEIASTSTSSPATSS